MTVQAARRSFTEHRKQDSRIGVATVYRMINALEEIGAISRKNMYKVECTENCEGTGRMRDHIRRQYGVLPAAVSGGRGGGTGIRVASRATGSSRRPGAGDVSSRRIERGETTQDSIGQNPEASIQGSGEL